MPVSQYTPDVAMVGAILRARTKTPSGDEAGTFMPAATPDEGSTRPTSEQVDSLIQDSLPDVVAAFGPNIPDAPGDTQEDKDLYRNNVKRIAALGAALLVELTYWPEQIATGRSPYAQLLERYNSLMKRTIEQISESSGGGEGGGGSVATAPGGYPSGGGFPTTAIGMETRW